MDLIKTLNKIQQIKLFKYYTIHIRILLIN
jgi:hypothetical protein